MSANSLRPLVVKIGSSTLTTSESEIDYAYLNDIAKQIARVRAAGWSPIVVTSAAIACGLEALGIAKRPSDMPSLQAAASVGQGALSAAYAKAFSHCGLLTSVVLLTRRDTADRVAYLHARDTLVRLLELGVVPVVNENDSVSSAEIETGKAKILGDNDTLSALVARLVRADLLVLLSDIDGLYDADPHANPDARLIHRVDAVTPDLRAMAGGAGTWRGTGGMQTKLNAAEVAMGAGVDMVITNGVRPEDLYAIVRGEDVGTRFVGLARGPRT